MYSRILVTVLLLLLLFLSAPVAAGPIQIRLHTSAASGTPLELASRYLGKLIGERSGGRIRIEIVTSAQSDRQYLQWLSSQQIQLSLRKRVLLNKSLLQLFDLPFLFQDRQHLYQVLDSALGEKLFATTMSKGFKTLAFWDMGFRQLLAGQALLTPQQAAGVKIAMPAGRITAEQFRAINLEPFPEESERQNLDARDTTLEQLNELVTDPGLSDLTLSHHVVSGELLLVNKLFWDKLPRDLQVIIAGAVKDATRYARELSTQQEEKILETIRLSGAVNIHRLTAAQRNRWRRKLISIYSQSVGSDILQLAEMVLAASPAENTRN